MAPHGAPAAADGEMLATRRSGLLIRRVMSDELLVLPVEGHDVVRLSGTALGLWSVLATPRPIGDIVGELASTYGLAEEQISADVLVAMETLATAGLINLVAAT